MDFFSQKFKNIPKIFFNIFPESIKLTPDIAKSYASIREATLKVLRDESKFVGKNCITIHVKNLPSLIEFELKTNTATPN